MQKKKKKKTPKLSDDEEDRHYRALQEVMFHIACMKLHSIRPYKVTGFPELQCKHNIVARARVHTTSVYTGRRERDGPGMPTSAR